MHVRIAEERLADIKLSIPTDSVKLCTRCHEKTAGRPATQKQIEVSSHAGTQQCVVCHNPHAPKIGAAVTAKAEKPGDAAAGRKKAADCGGCHGAEGVSENPEWPSLAGLQRGYLVAALQAYKSGARNDPMMDGQAKALSETAINELAAFYAGLSCKAAGSKSAQLAAAGKTKAAACAACHGAEGVSISPAFPSLAGQQEAYLANAIKGYQAGGLRKNAMMSGAVKGLSATDIAQLAAFYAGAKCK
jgi:cytochrome c553